MALQNLFNSNQSASLASVPSLGALKKNTIGSGINITTPTIQKPTGIAGVTTSVPNPIFTKQSIPSTPAATSPIATKINAPVDSSLGSPAAQKYMGTLADNQVNIGTTQNPNIQTNGQSNQNGLTSQQVLQGYSTIPGQFNPVSGVANNVQASAGTPNPLSTSSTNSSNTQQVDPTTGQALIQTDNSQSNQAYNNYLQSLQLNTPVANLQAQLSEENAAINPQQAAIGRQPGILQGFASNEQQAALVNDQAQIQSTTAELQQAQSLQGQQQQQALAGLNYSQNQQQLQQNLQLGLKPVATSYGQQVFNPATGTFSSPGGNNLDPQNVATNLAQQVASGKVSYSDAVNALGYANGTGAALLQQAIQQIPGANLNQLIGQSAATQQNAAMVGGVSTAANATGYTNALQTYNNLNTAANAAKDQATSVSDILSQSGLNNLNSTDANTAINNLSGRLGSTAVTALTTAIAELQNRYSTLLAQNGTTPSGAQTQALSLLNPNATAKQINQAISTLQNSAGILVGNQYTQLQQYANALNGSGSTGGNSNTSSGSSFGWNG